jgi:hypothetical protein
MPDVDRITIRLHRDRILALRWWARFRGVPLGSVIREALEVIADEIIVTYDRTKNHSPVTSDRFSHHIRATFAEQDRRTDTLRDGRRPDVGAS